MTFKEFLEINEQMTTTICNQYLNEPDKNIRIKLERKYQKRSKLPKKYLYKDTTILSSQHSRLREYCRVRQSLNVWEESLKRMVDQWDSDGIPYGPKRVFSEEHQTNIVADKKPDGVIIIATVLDKNMDETFNVTILLVLEVEETLTETREERQVKLSDIPTLTIA